MKRRTARVLATCVSLAALLVPAATAQARKFNVYADGTGVYKGYVRYNTDNNVACAYAVTGRMTISLNLMTGSGSYRLRDDQASSQDTCATVPTAAYSWNNKWLNVKGIWVAYDGQNQGYTEGYELG
jgi:hypothetical protein